MPTQSIINSLVVGSIYIIVFKPVDFVLGDVHINTIISRFGDSIFILFQRLIENSMKSAGVSSSAMNLP